MLLVNEAAVSNDGRFVFCGHGWRTASATSSMIAVGLGRPGVAFARLFRARRTVKHRMAVRMRNSVCTRMARALRITARNTTHRRADRLSIDLGVMRGLRNRRAVVVA